MDKVITSLKSKVVRTALFNQLKSERNLKTGVNKLLDAILEILNG